MTDQMEKPTGTVDKPNQPASVATSELNVEALVKALTPHFESIVDRKTQSVKDKRIAGLQGEIEGFKSQLAELKSLQAEGWSEAQALRLMETRQPKPVLQPEPQTPQAGNPAGNASVDTTVLGVMGLDPNDPQVTDILRSTPDTVSQINNLAKLAQARKTASTPNVAQMQPNGAAASGNNSREAALEEMERLNNKPGKTNAEWNRVAELQSKLRQME